MTTEISAATRLLPVSILVGPSAKAMLREVVASNSERRIALLAAANADSEQEVEPFTTSGKLVVEPLPTANNGDRDLRQVREKITALAGDQAVQHLIIECDSRTHPIAFASLFLPDGHAEQRLSLIAQLNSIIFAVKPDSLVDALVHGNPASGIVSPCVLADQIECADSIVFEISPPNTVPKLVRAIVLALNPRASVIEKSGVERLLDTAGPIDFESTFAGAGWRKLMDQEPGVRRDDQGVTAFMYRARRPFHPKKFWNLLQSPFPGVFRAKGFFWLATRMQLVGGLNIADSERHLSPAGEWWAAATKGDHSHDLEMPDRIKKEWAEPFGDRRQAIAFIGINIDAASITTQLDACLLTDAEMRPGEPRWAALPDPFPDWAMGHHDHECAHEDCCHH